VDASAIKQEDLCWRGELRSYDRMADKIAPKLPVPLEVLHPSLDFYYICTRDDEILASEFVNESSKATVAATDQVLACLMAAAQSKYSWHLTVCKLEGKLVIDKTDGSIVDMLTVNETSPEPPPQDDATKINRPMELSSEALRLNWDVSQQLLVRKSDPEVTYEKPPFWDQDGRPASCAYRYRFITIPGQKNHPSETGKKDFTVVTRGEVHAKLVKETGASDPNRGLVAIRALNEYTQLRKSWRSQLETQKGALLATEIRNNACKMAKWVAQAIIAGCDTLKLAYVTRLVPNDNTKHQIISVQTYKVQELGTQIGLNPDNAWGILRVIHDMVMEKPDGRYILLKDPTKAVLNLYKVPDDETTDSVGMPQAQ